MGSRKTEIRKESGVATDADVAAPNVAQEGEGSDDRPIAFRYACRQSMCLCLRVRATARVRKSGRVCDKSFCLSPVIISGFSLVPFFHA